MKYSTLVLILVIIACNDKPNYNKINSLILSNEESKLIEACNDLKTIEDTVFVSALLQNPYDTRISHDIRYKGTSVYEAKMRALRRISGLTPPNIINYKLDSSNVDFYVKWAKEKGYFK
jgi:hypothetical protein